MDLGSIRPSGNLVRLGSLPTALRTFRLPPTVCYRVVEMESAEMYGPLQTPSPSVLNSRRAEAWMKKPMEASCQDLVSQLHAVRRCWLQSHREGTNQGSEPAAIVCKILLAGLRKPCLVDSMASRLRQRSSSKILLQDPGSPPGVQTRNPDTLKDPQTKHYTWTWKPPQITRKSSAC